MTHASKALKPAQTFSCGFQRTSGCTSFTLAAFDVNVKLYIDSLNEAKLHVRNLKFTFTLNVHTGFG